jgi:hypothetical protein
MPTRHAEDNAPLAFERYMSSPRYAERRPLPANIVAEKAVGCSAQHRKMLFALQAMSMEPGGLARIAEEAGLQSLDLLDDVEKYACLTAQFEGNDPACITLAAAQRFLVRLCIDPAWDLENLPGSWTGGFDPIRIIEKYRAKRCAQERAQSVETTIGREVSQILNRALAARRMVVIEGLSGLGKTHATEAWCKGRPGEVRFVTLSGITHRTGFFQRIATALGLATSQRKSSELQAKIETFFHRTKLMLVIDESHNLWPAAERVYTSPELIDWVDTALVNSGVPVALICTDQFAKRKTRVEKQTGWTSEQFIHRTHRYHKLDAEKLTERDIQAVTRNLLSMRWDEKAESWIYDASIKPEIEAVDLISAYAFPHSLPLPSVRSIIEEARFLAHNGDGRDIVLLCDVASAVDSQQVSDLTARNAFRPGSKEGGGEKTKPLRKPLAMRPAQSADARPASRQTSHSLNHRRSPAWASVGG